MSAKDTVEFILNKINEYKKLGIKDSFEIEKQFIENYPEIYDNYTFTVKHLCANQKDLSIINKTLSLLEKTDGENVRTIMGEQLAEQFLYPNIKK